VQPKTYLYNPNRVLLAWLGFEQSCQKRLFLDLDVCLRYQVKPIWRDERFPMELGLQNLNELG